MDTESEIARLHRDLGLKRLNPVWAKAEIVLGLLAAAVGFLTGDWAVENEAGIAWHFTAASIALLVLGGYLAMAGHRSHLYQSANALAGYLAVRMQGYREPPDR